MSIFETIWTATEEAIRNLKKPLIANKIKRKFESGWDDAQSKILDAQTAVQSEFDKMKPSKDNGNPSLDIVKVLNLRRDIEDYQKTQVELKALYKEVFDEDMSR